MSAHASCGDALGVIRHAAAAVDDSAGSAPAAAAGHRLGSLDVPFREPLRWLHAPPAAQPAAQQDGELVYVTLPPEARAKMESTSFTLSGMETDTPELQFPDGSRFLGVWDTSVGTTMVFQDDDGGEGARAPGGEDGALQLQQQAQQYPRLVGTTETLLTFRPAPPLALTGGTAIGQV
jgi:hypothetical protein